PARILVNDALGKARLDMGHLQGQVHIPQFRSPKQLGIIKLLTPVNLQRISGFNPLIRAGIKLQLLILGSGDAGHTWQATRSEERRVGKECRSRWWRDG